jgi:hypothetical protein
VAPAAECGGGAAGAAETDVVDVVAADSLWHMAYGKSHLS